MRILLISPLPPPAGGIATWTELYLSSIIAKDNKVDLIDISVKGNRINNYRKINLKEEIKRTINIIKEVKRKIKLNEYNIVHLNTSCSKFGMLRDYFCGKLIKRKKIKLIMHCHCDITYMVNSKFSKIIFLKLCSLADEILVLNKKSERYVKNITNKEIHIIPNFFDFSQVKEFKSKQISNEIKSIIYVGHIVETKGCREILEVAKLMPNINFKLVGYLSEDIKRLNVPSNVEYTGVVLKSQVLEKMNESDLLLLPSYTEGFPNVILEAMACGLPIVATDVGAIPDIIEDNGGVIVEVRDINSIIQAINNLMDIKKRISISNWNKAKVAHSYTVDIVAKQILSIYKILNN